MATEERSTSPHQIESMEREAYWERMHGRIQLWQDKLARTAALQAAWKAEDDPKKEEHARLASDASICHEEIEKIEKELALAQKLEGELPNPNHAMAEAHARMKRPVKPKEPVRGWRPQEKGSMAMR